MNPVLATIVWVLPGVSEHGAAGALVPLALMEGGKGPRMPFSSRDYFDKIRSRDILSAFLPSKYYKASEFSEAYLTVFI